MSAGTSMRVRVTAVIKEHGNQTAETLMPHFPQHTREQLRAALNNANDQKLVHRVGRVGRFGLYAAGPAPRLPPPERLVNSVFALGSMNGAATLAADR
jgi:hypothetical protein